MAIRYADLLGIKFESVTTNLPPIIALFCDPFAASLLVKKREHSRNNICHQRAAHCSILILGQMVEQPYYNFYPLRLG